MEIGRSPSSDESVPAALNKRASPCEAAEPDFECPCCADVLLDPIVAPCGHDMCKGCYHKWCQASSGCPRCPSCRAPLPLTLGVCVRLKRIVEDMEPAASKRRRLEQEEEGNKASWKPAAYAACGLTPGAGGMPTWMPSDLQYQQQLGMAAMYAHYQQWGVQWMHAQSQADAATGTPVADVVHQQHRLNQQAMTGAQRPLPISMWMPGPAGQFPHLAAAEGPTAPADDPCRSTLSGMPHSTQCRWQSVADVPTRLTCAREILALICARPGAAAAAAGTASADSQRPAAAFTPATLSAVRAVEVALYRSANSREEYLDRSTLPSRVAAFVRRRAAVLVSSPVVTLPSSVAAN